MAHVVIRRPRPLRCHQVGLSREWPRRAPFPVRFLPGVVALPPYMHFYEYFAGIAQIFALRSVTLQFLVNHFSSAKR